jgi:integrase
VIRIQRKQVRGKVGPVTRKKRAPKEYLAKAGIEKRFTVHGLRYTFTDLVRLANVDAVVRRALTGHVTEEMQRHYSTVGMDEKRAAVAGVIRLVPLNRQDRSVSTLPSGTNSGTKASETASAG